MNKEVNEKKKKYAIVITFLVLMICITGGTYAYFALTASNNSVTGSVGGASLNLTVTKVYPTSEHNSKNMIPQLESTLDEAISTTNKCIDGNGNVICQVYSATVTNVGSTTSVLNGMISFTGIENMPNLKWMRINDSNTLGTYSSSIASTDKVLFEEEKSFGANTSNTYYFVFWIDETGEVQTDSGDFRANIEFDSSTGGLTSTLTPFETICEYQNNGVPEKTAGAKYLCEVKPGTSYNFYVLTTPKEGDKSINLIMDRNICEDGTSTDSSKGDKCFVAWISNEDYYEDVGGIIPEDVLNNDEACKYGGLCGYNDKGPVTAMNYLYKATKDWVNIPSIEMNYIDEGNYGYGTIITTNNITKITKKDGSSVTVLSGEDGYLNLKARLPFGSDLKAGIVNPGVFSNGSNNFLFEYLNNGNWSGMGVQPTNNISEILGYWLLLSGGGDKYTYPVLSDGGFGLINVSNNSGYGVRPVITLEM